LENNLGPEGTPLNPVLICHFELKIFLKNSL